MSQPQPYIVLFTPGPTASDEWARLGIEHQTAGRWPDAERAYSHALRLDPSNVRALNDLATVYASGGNFKEALLAIERCSIISRFGHPQDEKKNEEECTVYINWALILLEMEDLDGALEKAEHALNVHPCKHARITRALLHPITGDPEGAVPLYNNVLDEDPKHFTAAMNASFVQTLIDARPEELKKQRERFHAAQKGEPMDVPLHVPSLNCKPIRVGYVSGDYRRHSAAYIFGGVVKNHSPRVEPYLYSTQALEPDKDPVSKKYKDLAGDRWRDICGMSDEDADKLIRKDKIDILVDLSGHTGGCRLPLFTRKPAPIQVTAWGFAHGTGCPEIDYFFADPIAVPEEERVHYAEKVVDLPCIVTFDPPDDYGLSGVSNPPYQYNNGIITFGCFSRFEKLSTAYLATVQEILLEVPNSRLILKDNAYRRPYAIRRVHSIMDAVDPKRILFSVGTNQPDHFLAYQQCDLILDPFPHSGGTCCLEQLYMGVPLVTLYGKQAAGRTASSVLTLMGRGEWVTHSREEYIEEASARVHYIHNCRKTLRKELMESPVMKGYVEAVEQTYFNLIREKSHAAQVS